jgi:hypothetical protein
MKRKGRTSPKRNPTRNQPASTKSAEEYELTTKRRGELSELAFVFKAASLGFHVSNPYGDSERYDFILDAGHRLWRIQIKSTTTLMCGLYRINSRLRPASKRVRGSESSLDQPRRKHSRVLHCPSSVDSTSPR